MKKFVKILWNWNWLITFPFVIASVWWSINTSKNYMTFGVKNLTTPRAYSKSFGLLRTGQREMYHMLRRVEVMLYHLVDRKHKMDIDFNTIDLFIPESSISVLNSNLPHSGYNYIDGLILNNKEMQKIETRYRGDCTYHWGYFKKSMRIKTRKKNLLQGMHKFNLICPREDIVNNYLSYKLSTEMGLITPYTEMVNVTVNGNHMGIYTFVEQLDELILRRYRRIPGDIYSGDSIGKNIYTPYFYNFIFRLPHTWNKMSFNNHYPKDSITPLKYLLDLAHSTETENKHKNLTRILDMEAWGTYAAFITLTQSYHYNHVHNWRIYYDPSQEKFSPVVWDPLGWYHPWVSDEGKVSSMDIMSCTFLKTLFRNAEFLRARHDAIEKFYMSGSDKLFLEQTDRSIERVMSALKNDPNIHLPFFEYKKRIAAFRRIMENVFIVIKNGYLNSNEQFFYSVGKNPEVISLEINGRSYVKSFVLNYSKPFDRPVNASISYWNNSNKIERDISSLITVTGKNLIINIPLIANFNPNIKKFIPAYYELKLKNIDNNKTLLGIHANRGQKNQEARLVKKIGKTEFTDMYMIIPEGIDPKPEKWKGSVLINTVMKLNKNLIIEPGTIITFSPSASLILRGRLLARGTKEKPIKFVPANIDQDPWGSLVLLDKDSDGSQLEYCEFEGGSGLKDDLYEYSAMLSIHNVKRVRISDCIFRSNRIVDDMVHAVYSDINFSRCKFEDALSDALDLDICSSVIDDCRFVNNVNDGIDLMTSNAVVMNSLLKENRDKGISIGENSRLLAFNNRFDKNSIGVQSKDNSVAVFYNAEFLENDIALDLYMKNWRYNNGGRIFLYKGLVHENKETIKADKRSFIAVYDTYIDTSPEINKKRIKLDKSKYTEKPHKPVETKLWRYPEEIVLMENIFTNYWEYADPGTRGVTEKVNQ